MTTIRAIALLVMIGFGQGIAQEVPERFRTRLGKVVASTTWPGDAKRIVAVAYDYKQEEHPEVVVDGRLHKGVFLTSQALNDAQRKRLYSAITGANEHLKAAMCFEPHHGFVFYDASNKILGNLTICFGCNNYTHAPKGELSKVFDLKELKNLVMELKLPVLASPDGYAELFKKHRADHPADALSPKPEDREDQPNQGEISR